MLSKNKSILTSIHFVHTFMSTIYKYLSNLLFVSIEGIEDTFDVIVNNSDNNDYKEDVYSKIIELININ